MTATAIGWGCYSCNGTDHWADSCPERNPPEGKAEHEERIAKYVRWFRDEEPPRITLRQKRQLIENENAMWAKAKAKETGK
jgi:hypothetical protein